MKNSVANRIIVGLQEFADAIKNDIPSPTSYGPDEVKAVRKLLRASQVIFAKLLGVSPNTVRAWEQGRYPPRDIACRFMDEIRRNPEYWRNRLKDSVKISEVR